MQMSRDKRILECRLVLSLITSDSKVANYWLKEPLVFKLYLEQQSYCGKYIFICYNPGGNLVEINRNERGTNVFLMPNSTCMVHQ